LRQINKTPLKFTEKAGAIAPAYILSHFKFIPFSKTSLTKQSDISFSESWSAYNPKDVVNSSNSRAIP